MVNGPLWLLVPWAPTPTEGPELKVSSMEDGGGYVVRGTDDVLTAQRAVVQFRQVVEGERGEYTDAPPANRAGWFRWNPCNPRSCWNGGGHGGHLDYVDGPGHGRWQGVYLTWD